MLPILAQGDTIVLRVGRQKKSGRWTQPPDWNGTRDFRLRRVGPGTIGFQGHDRESVVDDNNIPIKPLDLRGLLGPLTAGNRLLRPRFSAACSTSAARYQP